MQIFALLADALIEIQEQFLGGNDEVLPSLNLSYHFSQ